MEFRNRLYDLRKRSGLSQEELADLVGVTRQAVQKWEAGTSRPDMDNLAALARYFNVTLDWLITGREMEARGAAQGGPVVVENHYHYNCWHYEYRSKRTLFGLPLVHVNLAQRGQMCIRDRWPRCGPCARPWSGRASRQRPSEADRSVSGCGEEALFPYDFFFLSKVKGHSSGCPFFYPAIQK